MGGVRGGVVMNFDGLALRLLPAVSAVVIVVAGVAMTVHALPKVR